MAEEIKLVWSTEALEQLAALFDYIAQNDLEAAKRVVVRLEKLSDALILTPEIGRVVPEYGLPELRERICKPSKQSRYAMRLIYRILPGQIEVISIWHTSRRGLPKL